MPIYPLLGTILSLFPFLSPPFETERRSEAAAQGLGIISPADQHRLQIAVGFATHTPASDYPSPTLAFPWPISDRFDLSSRDNLPAQRNVSKRRSKYFARQMDI